MGGSLTLWGLSDDDDPTPILTLTLGNVNMSFLFLLNCLALRNKENNQTIHILPWKRLFPFLQNTYLG